MSFPNHRVHRNGKDGDIMMKKIITISLFFGLALQAPLRATDNVLHEVSISNMSFNPSYLYINEGDTVKWTNNETYTHTVSSALFSGSGDLGYGDSYIHVFSSYGTYSYYCNYHTSMYGTIDVSPGGGTDDIDITYPDSNTEWNAGNTYTITWNTDLPSTETVSLELYKNGTSVYNIIGSTSNSGSYTFYVPDTVTTSDNFQIYIFHGFSGTSDYSDDFIINGSGGSTATELTNGQAVTGISGSATSELHYYLYVPSDQDTLNFSIDQDAGGTGDADLYVRYGSEPTTAVYDCRPYSSNYPEECGFSSPNEGYWYVMLKAFNGYTGVSLVGQYGTSGEYIDVTYPDSNTEWNAGNTYTITWDSNLNLTGGQNVSLWLKKDGSTHSNIDPGTDNDGSYEFTVPDTISTSGNYQVEIYQYQLNVIGLSDYFTITGSGGLTEGVYAPAAGDTLYTGDTETIAWYLPNANVPYDVGIYLDYKDENGNWLTYGTIETGVPVTDHAWEYIWNIPSDMPSDEYHVWLYSGSGNVNNYSAEFYVENTGGGSNLCEAEIEYVLEGDAKAYIRFDGPLVDGTCEDTGFSGYHLYREDDPSWYMGFGVTDNGTWQTNLTNGQTYCWYITALYDDFTQESSASVSVCGTPTSNPSVQVSGYISYPDNAFNHPSGSLDIGVFINPTAWPPTDGSMPNAFTTISPGVDFSSGFYYEIEVFDSDYPNFSEYFIAAGFDEDGDGNDDAKGYYSVVGFHDTDNIEANSYDFSIYPTGGGGGGPTSITVTSPGQGYQWGAGTAEYIDWSSTTPDGYGYNVNIELWENNFYYQDIIQDYASGPTGGSYYWSIPAAQSPSSNYQIKVKHSDSTVEGTSAVFGINSGGGGGGGSIDETYNHSWTLNEWHHIALEYDGYTMWLYIDGNNVSSWSGAGAVSSVANTMLQVGYGFNGVGDIIRISNTALYTGNNFDPFTQYWGANASTQLLWHCDESSGNQLTDESGNGYNGSFTSGSPIWDTNAPLNGSGGGGSGDYSFNFGSVSPEGAGVGYFSFGSSPITLEMFFMLPANQSSFEWFWIQNLMSLRYQSGQIQMHFDTGGGGGTEGKISGNVSLNEDHPFGQVRLGLWLPGSSIDNDPDIALGPWGENPPFADVSFEIHDGQIVANDGPYTIGGCFDENNNGHCDDGEPVGFAPDINTDENAEATGVNLVLSSYVGEISGTLSFDMYEIHTGNAFIGVFSPGDDDSYWANAMYHESYVDMSSGEDISYELQSSQISDGSGYSIAAFVDYDDDGEPGDLEPYVTVGDIEVSSGSGSADILVAYEHSGHFQLEASQINMVSLAGETVDLYLGIMNDGGGGPVLIDDITTQHGEFSVEWYPLGIAPSSSDFIHLSMNFASAGERTGLLHFGLKNAQEGSLDYTYTVEVYDPADASVETDTATVSGDGSYDLADANTNFDFTGVSGDGGTITATLVDGQYPSGDSSGVAERYWDITADFDFTSAQVCFDLNQLDASGLLEGINDFNSLVIYYRPSYSTDEWIEIQGSDLSYNELEGTICANNVSDFSQWTVGGGDNFLPSYSVTTDLDVLTGQAGNGLNVTATITGLPSNFIAAVEVETFVPGANNWATTTLSDADGDMTYDGIIQDNLVTPSGMLAAVVVHDTWNRISSSDTVNIPVAFNEVNLAQTSGNVYRMISAPGNLDDKSIAGVIEDELGGYDNTVYRVFRYNPVDALYEENTGQFTPSSAFWIITASDQTVQAGSGMSTPLTNVPTITLQPGWNMIATPYNADTYLSSFEVLSGSVETKVHRYTGSGYTETTQLQPGNGYWLFVTEAAQIKVKYPRPGSSKVMAKSSGDLPLDFSANIRASIGNARDDENAFGLIATASDEWDRLDTREPPVIGEYISVAFDNRDWSDKAGLYNTDIQPSGNGVTEWPLVVTTNKYGVVNLDFEWLTALDPGWSVYLVDRDLGLAHDLSEASHYSYASTGSGKERAFVIIAGEEADVTTEMGKYELIPDTYMLGQNIPNPFNPVTSIPIILGEDAFVTLSVYNIRGEEVSRILDHQSMTKGHHNSIWMGTDARGMKVPTGVYLYRLVAADNLGRMLYQHTRKMIMVK